MSAEIAMERSPIERARYIYWQYMEETAARRGIAVALGEKEKCLRGDLDEQHGIQIALRAIAHPVEIEAGLEKLTPKADWSEVRVQIAYEIGFNHAVTAFKTALASLRSAQS